MNRRLYNLFFYLALPIIFLRLLWRSLKQPAYRQRWLERLGYYGRESSIYQRGKSAPVLVIHAVSVGEVHAVVPLIEQIQQDWPKWKVVLTTSTPTGSARVKQIFGASLEHVYLPYDFPGAIRRFLSFFKPNLLIVMETELWPNLVHFSRESQIKVILANARLSEKSYKGYQKGGRLCQEMLLNIDVIAAQSKADGERFIKLGLPPERLQVTGTMKFDLALTQDLIRAGEEFKEGLGSRPVLVAASTREGEEEKVLRAFQQVLNEYDDVLLVLVPRHPQRFDEVFGLLQDRELNVLKRSHMGEKSVLPSVQVLLGDTMGEMQFYYSTADLVFVGGSLVATGCQNIIEPAALGLPVITGPSLFNFQSSSQLLIEAGAMQVVADEQALAQTVISLLKNTHQAKQMATKAELVAKANRGATTRLLTLVEHQLQS